MNICLQVNVSGEASKSGCAPQGAAAGAGDHRAATTAPARSDVHPGPSEDPAEQRAAFARLRQLRDELALDLDTLSMGMSQDLEAAIAEGATWVRIGTALFGARDYGRPQ